jgi:hypothetical protein
VGNEAGRLPLWKQSETASLQVGSDFAYKSQVGIRLLRGEINQTDALTTHLHRILVKPGGDLTISGMVRGSKGSLISLQISWYPDTVGSSTVKIIEPLVVKEIGVWQPFQLDIQVPSDILALGVFP